MSRGRHHCRQTNTACSLRHFQAVFPLYLRAGSSPADYFSILDAFRCSSLDQPRVTLAVLGKYLLPADDSTSVQAPLAPVLCVSPLPVSAVYCHTSRPRRHVDAQGVCSRCGSLLQRVFIGLILRLRMKRASFGWATNFTSLFVLVQHRMFVNSVINR